MAAFGPAVTGQLARRPLALAARRCSRRPLAVRHHGYTFAHHDDARRDGRATMAASNGTPRSEHSRLMDPDTYFKRMVQPDTRPGIWRWDDIVGVLDEMDKQPK